MSTTYDETKRGLLITTLYKRFGVVIAFDQNGIDNEGGRLQDVIITRDFKRFTDEDDVIFGYFFGSNTLDEVLVMVDNLLVRGLVKQVSN